jgi:hypothetical protein
MNMLVPTLKQKYEYDGCTLTSLKMMMNYYGDDISEKELQKGLDNIGGAKIVAPAGNIVTVLTKVAIFSKLRGYDVECHTSNFDLLGFSSENLEPDLLIKYFCQFGKLEKQSMTDNDKIIYDSYSDLLDYGAVLRVKIPNVGDIMNFLDKDVPVLLKVNTASFYKKNISWGLAHAIVATGYKDDIIYYNDPSDGKAHEVDERSLFYSLNIQSWNVPAYLLAITPGKKK